MIKKVSLAVGLLGLAMSMTAQAEVLVSPLLAFFSPGNNIQDVTITNQGSSTAYVEVLANAVQNPGDPSQKLIPYQVGTDASSFGLMIAPTKLAIPANSEKEVRLVALKDASNTDLIYYISFVPVKSLVSETSSSASGTNIQMSNQVSYRVQAVVLPVKPMPEIAINRQGTLISVKNTGNSYASLRNGEICDGQGNNCKALPAELSYKVLYAGNTWSFTAPSAGVVKFDVIYNKDKKMSAQSN